MTLSQILLIACKKVGRNNEAWREDANEFAQARAEFIWDFYDWQDSLVLGTKTLAIGETETTLDSTVEKVVKCKWDDTNNLQHLPLNRVFEYTADVFNTNGTPFSWTELAKDADGVRALRVYPPPSESKTLLYLAKKKFEEIGINEQLPLTAQNNCLQAFVLGDLWEKARQQSKANAKFEEAMAMLETMKSNEISQAGLELEVLPDATFSGALEDWWE